MASLFQDKVATDTSINLNTSDTFNSSSEEFQSSSPETTSASFISAVLNTTIQSILSEIMSSASNYSSLNDSSSVTATSTTPSSTLLTSTAYSQVNLSSTTMAPCPCSNVTTPVGAILNATKGNISETVAMMASMELVFTVIPLSLISLLIIFGNLLVIVAVFTQKSLRSPQNIYIVSLAVADMAVGLVICPFSITYMVLRRWPLGAFFCKVWLTGDVALCCVSIFHLCAIGVDRFRAITDGINYVQKRNLRSVLWTVGILWILAIWIGSPPILALNNWKIVYDGTLCHMPLDAGYAFHLATGALFFPLLIMSVIYAKIYQAIKERLRERAKVACIELTSDGDTTERLDSSEAGSQSTEDNLDKSIKIGGTSKRKPSAQISTFLVNKQKFSLSRERKAARTLGIIMGTFVVCWLPLGFLNTIGAMLPVNHQPSEGLFHALTWLGYINSALNPIVYAISHQEFQKAFRRVLHLG